MTSQLDAMTALGDAIRESLARSEWATVALLCAVIEDWRAGSPLPILDDAAAEADWWASMADPITLEAHIIAISRHLPETFVHQKARKRMIATLYKAMTAADQAAFIEWCQK